MRRISTSQRFFILGACAFAVFPVVAISNYRKFNVSEIVPKYDFEYASFRVFWAIHTPLILILSRLFTFKRVGLTNRLLIYSSTGVAWAMIVQESPLLFLIVLRDLSIENSGHVTFREKFGLPHPH